MSIFLISTRLSFLTMAANLDFEELDEIGVGTGEYEHDVGNEAVDDRPDKSTRLPLTRIKTIMKLDPDITLASQEAVFLIAKATELFIECLSKESYSFTSQNKKKTIQRKDIDASIESVDALVFLEGSLD